MLGLRHFAGCALDLFVGDITEFACDAMANAANESLSGGGGVDGAIHRAAGPGLFEQCKTIGGCSTGDAVVTDAFDLPAKHVIHGVGPVWRGGQQNEELLLKRVYKSVLSLAEEVSAEHLACPSISTGVYNFPVDLAAVCAFSAIKEFLVDNQKERSLKRLTFVLFDTDTHQIYQEALFKHF